MGRLLIATTNHDKVREISGVLDGLPFQLVTLEDWSGIAVPPEDAPTFIENARSKARHYARLTGELTVAEDSGLEIDALGGAPGVQSARFGGPSASYPDRFQLIYSALRAKGVSGSTARFVCAAVLADGRGIVFEVSAALEGCIAPEPRGSAGFGYDPIFLHPPDPRTLAEMTAAEKAAISHRGQAFRSLRRFLESGQAPSHGWNQSGARAPET
jgi:XTP/dITP diphosphohydrolase